MNRAAGHSHAASTDDAGRSAANAAAAGADHHHGHGCAHSGLGEHAGAADAVCVDGVSHWYGPVQALRDVTLHIESGCILGIIGPNGGGKTTLLKILLGLLEPNRGSVQVLGQSPRDICRGGNLVGYVPQRHEYERRFPVNVRQVVRMGLAGRAGWLWRYRRDDLDRVEQLMQQVGVAELADRPIGNLSGGQQQRAFIARALAAGPRILILDEPTIGIDVSGQQQFAELIHRLHDEHGLTVIIVSHDLRAVAASCEKVACLARSVHYHDAPAGLTEEVLREVFRHDIEPLIQQ